MSGDASTIFVVDDDPSVRKGLSRQLRAAGHTVESFASAREFLNQKAAIGPACVLLDVHMPDVTGLDLQKELNQRGRDESIIFMTAQPAAPMTVVAMKGGAVDFLIKPFEEDDLLRAVAQALNRSTGLFQARKLRDGARALLDTLTFREFEVFELVVAGLLNKQIADKLGAAVGTIKVHRGRVTEKLRATSAPDLLRLRQLAEGYQHHTTKVV